MCKIFTYKKLYTADANGKSLLKEIVCQILHCLLFVNRLLCFVCFVLLNLNITVLYINLKGKCNLVVLVFIL